MRNMHQLDDRTRRFVRSCHCEAIKWLSITLASFVQPSLNISVIEAVYSAIAKQPYDYINITHHISTQVYPTLDCIPLIGD